MVEEKKISEEKDEGEDEEEKKVERDEKEEKEERRKALPPTLIPGPPRSSRQASVDRGSLGIRSRQGSVDRSLGSVDRSLGIRSRQGSVDTRDPIDPNRVQRKGSVDRATAHTAPE